MATLIIHRGPHATKVDFTPPQPLSQVLAAADASIAQPCGGRGVCGKCAVALFGDVSDPTSTEAKLGACLACQAVLLGDAEVTLPTLLPIQQVEGGSAASLVPTAPMAGRYGAAIDVGTTTIAMLLYDLSDGCCIGASSMLNPQTSVAADVIGRIDAALHGKAELLRIQVESALKTLLATACSQAEISISEVDVLVITGNTTMLYLLTGRDLHSLSRAPFMADHLFGHKEPLLARSAYLPGCLHAFVGADTTCALLASDILQRTETALLCDVGTNGELALWHRGHLYIASTAAGPAFEGAGISCGCTSIPGAIDQVTLVNGTLHCHTINECPAIGICGSGLLDAVAASLDLGLLDETGYIEDDCIPLRDGIQLEQSDIRSVQLAKAATHAGIMSLLDAAHCDPDEVSTLYLAGGFGSHLNIRSAVRIGLIPAAFERKVKVIGNAALDGAASLLMDTTQRVQIAAMQRCATHVRLDGNPAFADLYVESMLFDT
ncbi:MAG: DUF4445 domain-containing protein [Clostridia bacterium]|nr:DUF4445 domain-containing protein [Clostridia bacterium]